MNRIKTPAKSTILVFALWMAGLIAAGQFAKIATILPDIAELYGEQGVRLGLVVSLISFLGVVFGLFAGVLVSAWGYRKLLLSSLVFAGAISLVQSLLPSLPMLLFSRLIEGATHLLIVVAAPSLMAQATSSEHRGFALTLWGTFFGVSFAIFGFLSPWLVMHYAVPSVFLLHGAWSLVVALLLYVVLPADETDASSTPITAARIFNDHVETYRSPEMAAAACGWVFYTLVFVATLSVVTTFLPETQREFARTVLPLVGIGVSLLGSVTLQRKMSALSIVYIGFALSVVFAGMFWIFNAPLWACIGLFAGLGLVQGATFVVIPELISDKREQALANGAMAQMGNLGNLCGTPLVLFSTQGYGLAGLSVFVMLFSVLGIAAHMVQQQRREH